MSHDTPAIESREGGSTAHDTSFVPRLDARQRAMLAEMGVRIWSPKPAGPVTAPQEAAAPAALAEPRAARAPDAAAVPPPPSPAAAAPRVATAPAARQAPPPARPVSAVAPMPEGIDTMDWVQLRDTVAGCRACGLCEGRTQAVFGTGHGQADWMFVGDAPGATEDQEGEPYLGEAGQLLDNMLRAVGLSRSGVGAQAAHVTHVTRCRPSPNRNPQPAEVAQCAQYLARQVALVNPKVIVAMGPLAAQALLQNQDHIGKLRGQVHRFQGVPVVVTFPPSHLLHTPANKGKAWADLCLALEQVASAA